jgi:hypothetical protein
MLLTLLSPSAVPCIESSCDVLPVVLLCCGSGGRINVPSLLLFVAVVGCISTGVDGNAPLFFSPSSLAAAVAAALTYPRHWCSSTLVIETATALRWCPSSLRQWGRPSLFWQWSRPTCYCPSLSWPASWSCPFCYSCLAVAVAAASTCPCCRCCLSTLLVSSALALMANTIGKVGKTAHELFYPLPGRKEKIVSRFIQLILSIMIYSPRKTVM